MERKIDKAKVICSAYRNGQTVTQIARAFNHDTSVIDSYLKRYFEYFYGERYKPYAEKHAEFMRELYEKYNEIYVHGFFSREEMCNALGCSVQELEAMFRKYNVNYQWLKTYSGQKTLCNVSSEFYNSVKEFAKKHNFKSVRAVAVAAINEFMLQQAQMEVEE